MKIRQLLLIIISLAFAFEASAQSCHVVYSYDSAGNRVQQFKVSPVPWAAVDDSVMRDRIDSAQLPGKALARIDASIKLSAVAVPLMHEEERIQPAWVLPCWKQDKYSVYSLFFSTSCKMFHILACGYKHIYSTFFQCRSQLVMCFRCKFSHFKNITQNRYSSFCLGIF